MDLILKKKANTYKNICTNKLDKLKMMKVLFTKMQIKKFSKSS